MVSHFGGNFPDRAVPGDLDADGDFDLVVGNCFAGDVSVLQGNGDGTFDIRTTFLWEIVLVVLMANGNGTLEETVVYPTKANRWGLS